jgi:hypothetical protein
MWKANGKSTTLLLFLDSLFPKTDRYICICEMLPLETKFQSGDKLLPHSDLRGGSVSKGNNQQQALQQEGKEEGIAQLQDWNVECKNFESRRQTGKFEKGNAEQ